MLLLILIPHFLLAQAEQNKTFLETDQKNRVGSDASLKQSTGYAMNALMDLSNLNISSAMKNGVNAYGKYQNSETLDKLSNQNMFYSAGLTSAGDKAPNLIPVMTTYRRLDPKFLREGQLGKIAADFEKKSGMKRDQFLLKMSEASESKIKRSDPNLVGKVLGRFESFVSSIPNAQFRSSIKKATNMVPQKTVAGIIQKTVKQYSSSGFLEVESNGSSGSNVSASSPQATTGNGASSLGANGNPGALKGESNRTLASESSSPEPKLPLGAIEMNKSSDNQTAQSSEAVNRKQTQEMLSDVLKAAKDAQENEPTIFEQVHSRYRTLAPGLQPLSPQ